jgi:large subunit ribosomal protein L23
MSLFKKTAKKEKAVKTAEVAVVQPAQAGKSPAKPALALSAATSVLIRPHITEKSGLLANQGVYTFEVTKDAIESSVIQAVSLVYKVTPLRASLMPIKTKTMFARGKSGKTGGGKKAYVYLAKGDKIEFI